MLKARNLHKEYLIKKGFLLNKSTEVKKAVNDISLDIEKGQIVGLLGVNGAGKTTTIKMLTTMISPTSGSINIDSIDAVKDYMEAKKKINLITGGERNIYWRLTAKENLEYFGSLYGINKKELSNRIDKVLEIVDLDQQKDIPVEKYSKGMKQRLQIARGLINNPEYLFMDEPTLGLDIMISRSLHNYIKKLAKEENKGILITTHYIFEAEELCDYIYVIDNGKIVTAGTPSDIKKMYTSKNTCSIKVDKLDAVRNVVEVLQGDNNIVELDDENSCVLIKTNHLDLKTIISILGNNNIKIIDIEIFDSSLEDALFEILGGK